ncbi:hypothetical protein ACLOJK_026854, partial [Asimina triloba]
MISTLHTIIIIRSVHLRNKSSRFGQDQKLSPRPWAINSRFEPAECYRRAYERQVWSVDYSIIGEVLMGKGTSFFVLGLFSSNLRIGNGTCDLPGSHRKKRAKKGEKDKGISHVQQGRKAIVRPLYRGWKQYDPQEVEGLIWRRRPTLV